jgi:aryl-alcohol dehydrogenase-like predicted oxidoreductase
MHSEKLGLGTVQFGIPYGISNTSGQTPPEEVRDILALALKNNIKVLDTASAYGAAESVLGEVGVEGFEIVSKFMTPAEGETISLQLKATFQNLKQEKLYGYLAHRPQELLKKPELWEELQGFKEEGLIIKRGFSLNKPEELERLLEKGMHPDLIQVPYNYLDNRFEELMKELHSKGCEIHTRSAFLQGLFFRDAETLPDFFNEVKPVLSHLQSEKASLSGKLLKYVLQKPFIDKVIIGVENAQQLQQNLDDIHSAPALPQKEKQVPENILMPMYWPQA